MLDTMKKKLSRLKNKFFSGIVYLFGVLLVLTSISVLCFQGFEYLYQGGWTPQSLQFVLAYTPYSIYSWVLNPESWLGLHKFVSWVLDVPLSFASFIVGYLLIKFSDFIALFSD